jgi:anti-anti-sigma factor
MLVEIASQNGVCIVRLQGRFVMATDVDYLRSKTDEIKTHNHSKLLVDLSEVSSICSTVIGFLVDLYTSTTRKAEGRFVLAGANSRVREVLDLTRLSTIIPLAADTVSGLAELSGENTAQTGTSSAT